MKIPSHLGYYEGKEDPDDYINVFEGAARMAKWDMAMACHALSYMLKSDARIWFDSLAKDSVSSFEELKRHFKSKFSQQKRHKKNHVAAHSIRHKEHEATRAFLSRYTDETQQIAGLPETQRISGLLYGCRARSLVEHLTRDLPDNYEKLLDRAYVWLDAKETPETFTYEDQSNSKQKEKSSNREERHGKREDKGRYAPYKRENNAGILGTLIKTLKEILSTKKLKLAIEDAIRSGKLSHLVKGIRKTTKASEPVNEDKKPNTGKAILAIESCFAVESRRHFKRSRSYQVIDWEEISFPALDTIMPSDQPVTISGMIFDRDVHRIYLDSGSSCDVMYEHCFQQLSPTIKARLMPPRVPLVGFSGERCWPIGEIDLDLTIGELPMTRTEILDFVVVRENSQHNILLGRMAMMKMGIVVSTVHQLVKFHTSQGIATLPLTYDQGKVIMAIK
ncbi:uncharacterized protein [Rutidosis leptorrhynchoides]|uniref:uncharacterized protein n=1 Tax=Rutidosis leptorrhynchoides TaxID=125765 RepID=UPI003A995413